MSSETTAASEPALAEPALAQPALAEPDRELAEAVILDHDARPRNFGKLGGASHQAEGYSPLCGDRYSVALRLEDDQIVEVRFEGFGCAISKASASMMTELVNGQSSSAAVALLEGLEQALMQPGGVTLEALDDLGELRYLLGVREYPTRVKCALLPWRTLQASLEGRTHVETR